MAKSKNSQGKSSKSSGGSSPMPSFERLKVIEPLTDNQKKAFNAYLKKNNSNLVLSGSAGTGKTFLAMYLALQEILSGESKI